MAHWEVVRKVPQRAFGWVVREERNPRLLVEGHLTP